MLKVRHFASLLFILSFFVGLRSSMAANVHFIDPPTVSVDLEEFTVEVSGKLAGLGNKDVTVIVEVNGTAEIWVYNPGENLPPGKNKVPFYSVDDAIFHPDAKNGTVTFALTVDFSGPLDESLEDTILPNENWTADLQNIDVTSVKVTVVQNNKVVLTQTFNNL